MPAAMIACPHLAALPTPAQISNIDLHLRCRTAEFGEFVRSMGSFPRQLIRLYVPTISYSYLNPSQNMYRLSPDISLRIPT